MVPIQVIKGLILVHATVDGHTGMWLLDTGSPQILLNASYWNVTTSGVDTNIVAATSHEFPVPSPFSEVTAVVHSLHIGALTVPFDLANASSQRFSVIDRRMSRSVEHDVEQPVLGILGLPAWRPFETIIDYRHHQLTLIRLDAEGHRLTSDPQFTPVDSVSFIHTPDEEHYGVRATIGDSVVELLLDTGAGSNVLGGVAQARLQTYLTTVGYDSVLDVPRMRMKEVKIGKTSHSIIFACRPGADLLGYPYLHQLGTIGFNLRARRLYIYQ
jgi:hypothetical protein